MRRARIWHGLGLCFLTAAASLMLGGCVAGGLAAGPLMSAIQAVGQRTVERTLPADVQTSSTVLLDTLLRFGVVVKNVETGADGWRLEGSGGSVSISARLVPLTPKMTRLTLRVEDGGFLPDRTTATEILTETAAGVSPRPFEEGRAAEAEARLLASLQEELRRVRALVEQTTRTAPSPAAARPPSADAETRVILVPPSYGLPTVPGATSLSAPASAVVGPASMPSRSGSERSPSLPVDIPLAAAEVLVPVGRDQRMTGDR
jgi:hypothetical protein